MPISAVLSAIRRSWWIVAGVIVLSLGAGWLITSQMTSIYASSVTFFVRTPAEQIGGAYQGDQFAQKRVNSYVQLAESQRLADAVLEQTQVDLSEQQLSSMITAKGDANTVLLTITVTDSNPQRSLDIAQSISQQFVSLVSELETPPGQQNPTVSLDVTSAAALNPSPVAPRLGLNLALAAALGLILGVAIAMVRQLLDNTVRSRAVLKEIAPGIPVLAATPNDPTAKTAPLVTDVAGHSIRAEAFRQLRTNLQFVSVDEPVKVIVVTSSVPNEGKSSTASNMAVMFAEAGEKVVLVEADLRRPRVADYLGLEGSVGLTNVLAGQVALDDVLQPWGRGGLTVLPSGAKPPNPSELLGSQNMKHLIGGLKETFDVIVVDTPPLLPVTDAAILAAQADATLLVVRFASTTRQQIIQSVETLAAVGAPVTGFVLNMEPRGRRDKGYGEYSYYGDPERTDAGRAQRPDVQPDQGAPFVPEQVHDGSPTRDRIPVGAPRRGAAE